MNLLPNEEVLLMPSKEVVLTNLRIEVVFNATAKTIIWTEGIDAIEVKYVKSQTPLIICIFFFVCAAIAFIASKGEEEQGVLILLSFLSYTYWAAVTEPVIVVSVNGGKFKIPIKGWKKETIELFVDKVFQQRKR